MSLSVEFQGSVISRGNGEPTNETFAEIAEITSVSGPSGSASVIDVTHVKSAAKEKKMGLMDEGQLTLELNLAPGDNAQKGLRDDRTNRTQRNFKIELPDKPDATGTGTIFSFAAYVSSFSVNGAIDGVWKGSVTLEITGPVTWTDAAAGA